MSQFMSAETKALRKQYLDGLKGDLLKFITEQLQDLQVYFKEKVTGITLRTDSEYDDEGGTDWVCRPRIHVGEEVFGAWDEIDPELLTEEGKKELGYNDEYQLGDMISDFGWTIGQYVHDFGMDDEEYELQEGELK